MPTFIELLNEENGKFIVNVNDLSTAYTNSDDTTTISFRNSEAVVALKIPYRDFLAKLAMVGCRVY